MELCAALSDLQSHFDLKQPSFSSPSNSPHGGFLSGLTEALIEDAPDCKAATSELLLAVNTFMVLKQRLAINSTRN